MASATEKFSYIRATFNAIRYTPSCYLNVKQISQEWPTIPWSDFTRLNIETSTLKRHGFPELEVTEWQKALQSRTGNILSSKKLTYQETYRRNI
jgi:hypothetical protein